MKEDDFSVCEFIEERMWYFTYYDFCDNKYTIKSYYEKMNFKEKRFYKYYVYANIHMDTNFKNAIWEFLNGYDPHGLELLRLKRFYKVK